MTTRYTIVESGTGEVLGEIGVDDEADDEHIIETLCEGAVLEGEPDDYHITESDGIFGDPGDRVVRDNTENPVLTLEPEDVDDDDAEDDDDDPDEDGDTD